MRSSYCFSYGDGIASLVKLEDLVDSVVAFAWVNIVLAVAGGMVELVVTFLQARQLEEFGNSAMSLVILAAVSELVIGVVSFFRNTQELIAEIYSMEAASLGIESFEEGHACFVRSTDDELTSTSVVGVEWNVPWGLYIILPALLVLLSYTITIAVVVMNISGSGHTQ